jgi:hypothetical protein
MDQRDILFRNAFFLLKETGSQKLFLFLNNEDAFRWFLKSGFSSEPNIVLVVPKDLDVPAPDLKKAAREIVRSWPGNQSRFSQIKYAFLHGVLKEFITTDSKVVCLLGPWGSGHLDTVTVHDLTLSWTEEFPFDPRSLVNKKSFETVMAVVDIALDIGTLGREGRAVGTAFVIGDEEAVLKSSHQQIFNPFLGYRRGERMVTRPEVVESIKELAKLDGAIVISSTGVVEAVGRHLEARSTVTKQLRGLGSRHRAAAGITRKTEAVAVVVSESTGKVTIFDHGKIVSTLEPVISRRLV